MLPDDEIREIFAELRRIGVDLGQPPGLALGTGFREGELIAWLRALPDNLGHDAFVETLNAFIVAATPNVLLDDGEPIPSPRRYSPTVEQAHAACDILTREWDPLGARLGELTRDDVAIPAYNAVDGILRGGPTRNVEARIAANLRTTEREVFGVRASPLVQTRYLVRRIMQAVAENPGPPHDFDPFERIRQDAEAADAAEPAAADGRASRSGGRTVKIIIGGDEPEPFDPAATCSECGTIGTVAFVKRAIDPRLSRYCDYCWHKLRHKYSPLHQNTHESVEKDWVEAQVAAFERMYEQLRERWTSAGTALWEDRLLFIRMALEPNENVSPTARGEGLKRLVTELVKVPPHMRGAMPPDIAAIVQQYTTPDA